MSAWPIALSSESRTWRLSEERFTVTSPTFTIIIPARYASVRLPGKPLRDVAGKPLISRVVDAALASAAQRVIVATDDQRITRVVRETPAEVCMTDPQHLSGTDRIAEVIGKLKLAEHTVIVNLQGDEPQVPTCLLEQLAACLDDVSVQMASLCVPLTDCHQLEDSSVVKVVRDAQDYALYFSRSAIPFLRDGQHDYAQLRRHLGLYAYRADFVKRYAAWPASPLERDEKLEQLRVLWHGIRILVPDALQIPPPGVDTLKDLERVNRDYSI